MRRATISLHTRTEKEHIDIFFETSSEDDKNLATYQAEIQDIDRLLEGEPVKINRKADHRRIYLDFEGDISGNRGEIKILWQGFYPEKIDLKSELIIKIVLKYIESC